MRDFPFKRKLDIKTIFFPDSNTESSDYIEALPPPRLPSSCNLVPVY